MKRSIFSFSVASITSVITYVFARVLTDNSVKFNDFQKIIYDIGTWGQISLMPYFCFKEQWLCYQSVPISLAISVIVFHTIIYGIAIYLLLAIFMFLQNKNSKFLK